MRNHTMQIDNNNHSHPRLNNNLNNTNNRLVPLFEEYLPNDYQSTNLPLKLLKKRNYTLIAIGVQIASTLAGFSFFFMRRIILYLIANLISLIISTQGIYGALTLRKLNIAIHAIKPSTGYFFCIALIINSRYCIYKTSADYKYSERTTLLLFSLPYLIDFIAGIISFDLIYHLLKEEELRAKNRLLFKDEMVKLDINEESMILNDDYDENSKFCIICMIKQKNMVGYPCGHVLFCGECGKKYKASQKMKCPVCRRQLKDIISTYR